MEYVVSGIYISGLVVLYIMLIRETRQKEFYKLQFYKQLDAHKETLRELDFVCNFPKEQHRIIKGMEFNNKLW